MILIIEDDPNQLADYAARLEALGYAVETAATAEDGITLVERKRFDVLLTDNLLPGMSGLSSIPELRQRSSAPIFLMTSHPYAEFEKDVLLLGAKAYFPKPLDFQEVHRLLQAALTAGRAHNQPSR